MALTYTEQNSWRFGGHVQKLNVVREVTVTAAAAADVADDTAVPATTFRMEKAIMSSVLINSTGQAFELIPNFAQTGFVIKKRGTFTPTDLVFQGVVIGR